MLKTIIPAAIAAFIAVPGHACGVQTDCSVTGGTYRIDLPNAAPNGAIIFAHGYRGSANGTMRNGNFRRAITDMGLAFVAIDAGTTDWQLPNAPGDSAADGSDDFNYVAAVVDDLGANHGVTPDQIMISGFSAGGMLVWNLACARPDLAGGFAPVSGTFWLEPPDTCTTPTASLIHLHGDSDTTVPLGGRPIGRTRQGDVGEAIAFYSALGGYNQSYTRSGSGLECNGGSNGRDILEFCQFEGGHSFSRNYLINAWEQFIDVGQIKPN